MSNSSCAPEAMATAGHSVGYGLNCLGIALGCVGSISINIGNNLQAKGHADTAKAGGRLPPGAPNLWALGTAVFFMASIIQFVAFAFAPASVVAPLESLQFVANLAFAKFVNGQTISTRMLSGTALILLGTVVAVVFGPVDGTIIVPLETLIAYWVAPGWLIYLSLVISIACVAQLVHFTYADAAKRGVSLPGQARVLPLSFATSSSLIGTQAVVQAKCAAEAVKLMAAGCVVELLESWYLYLTILILASCGVLWVFRLNTALATYDPLFIIPLLQSQYILCATLSGGIYFQEFVKLTAVDVTFFILGIVTLLAGLLLMMPPAAAKAEAMGSAERTELSAVGGGGGGGSVVEVEKGSEKEPPGAAPSATASASAI